MVKIVIGEKGMGKTKTLLEKVDEALLADKGSIVFINKGDRHVYDLNYRVRLINTEDFECDGYSAFYGFLCGIISQDYDISDVFVDSITKITSSNDVAELERFLEKTETLCEKFNVDIMITVSMDAELATPTMKKYI